MATTQPTLRIGAVFPQTEIGADPAGVREYARGVEELGFDHILAYDHVLGADTASRPGWSGPYTSETMFHEVLTLFAYLAAITERVELVTGILILPQRQTVLVAKQAAEVDVLSGGRFRLGIGVGWNPVEFEGLNEDFSNRGARSAEQIAVLKALWTQPVVTFHGKWHTIPAAGINPLPVQRPIPIWLGGHAEQALQRAARLGDGWMPQTPPNEGAREQVARLRAYTREAGRPEDAVGIEARLSLARTPEAEWGAIAAGWQSLGATHLTINTMGLGHTSVREHLDSLQHAKAAIGG
jgi:probable F420-dependent oxidoreductase